MTAPQDIDLPGVEIDGILVWRVQVDLDRTLLPAVENYLSEQVERGVWGVVLDLASLPVIDSEMTETIRELLAAIRLVGGTVCICGLRPAVALCLVHLDQGFGDVPTARDLVQAREILQGADL